MINFYKKSKWNWLKTVKDIIGCFWKRKLQINLTHVQKCKNSKKAQYLFSEIRKPMLFNSICSLFFSIIWYDSLHKKIVILKIKFLCTSCRFFHSIVRGLFLPLFFNILFVKLEHSYRTFHFARVINLPLYTFLLISL